jgi:stage II sporulation protein AA (anti-sigma F factor antagonist)
MGPPISVREEGQLVVRIDQGRDALLVRASGEIDLASAGMLGEELGRAWDADASFIVLDLGGVDFIDSTGLQVLLRAAERSREDGNRLSVWLGPAAAVRRLVELSGVEGALPLTKTSRGVQPR